MSTRPPRPARPAAAVLALLALAPAVQAAPPVYHTPFQRTASVEVPAGALSASTSFPVPAGRRLVLEFASGFTRVHVSELVRLEVRTTAGGATVTHVIAPSVYRREFAAANPDFSVSFSQALRLYADPAATVTVRAVRSENAEITPTFFQLAVSGYLVDCGPGPACPIP